MSEQDASKAGRIVWSCSLEGEALDFGGESGVQWTEDSTAALFRGVGRRGEVAELRGPEFPPVKSAEEVLIEGGD